MSGSNDILPELRLVVGEDPPRSYNWFGGYDYGWFDTPSNLSSVPYFEETPERLDKLLQTSAARESIRLSLSPGECTTAGSRSRNCTAACTDSSSLLTPSNLHTCIALASAALLVQNGTYAVDVIDAETIRTMNSWGVPDLATFNATGVLRELAQCLPESCIVSTLGECAEEVRSLGSIEPRVENLEEISSALGHYCDGTQVDIIADIAGQGVLLSYFLQISLAVCFYMLTKGSTAWIGQFGALFSRRNPHRQKKLAAVQQKVAGWRLGPAVRSTLLEFQEMQIFFTISVQIATLSSFNSEMEDNPDNNNTSFSGAIFNSGLASILCISTTATMLLTQCALPRVLWWYSFALMTASCVLSAIVFMKRSNLTPPPAKLWEKFTNDAPLPLCGGNPSPMTFCRMPEQTRFMDNDIAGYSTFVVCLAAWLGLLVDQLLHNDIEWLSSLVTGARDALRKGLGRSNIASSTAHQEGRKRPWTANLVPGYWFIIQALLFILAFIHISVLALIVEGADFAKGSGWNFGQLIAVTLWAPTIAKFIYYNIFGVKAVSEKPVVQAHSAVADMRSKRAGGETFNREAHRESTYP